MQYVELLLPLALILVLSKLAAVVFKKCGLTQVVGMLLAGVLLGLIKLIPGQRVFTSGAVEGLNFLAKIGVIFIMFSAGIETDLQQFKKTGFPSVVITVLGVAFPLLFGFLVSAAFHGGFAAMTARQAVVNLFYGSILAATSVSITVAALKELGKLQGRVGTSIVSAAILDDIIGIVLLSLLIGLGKSGQAGDAAVVVVRLLAFFVTAVSLGLVISFVMRQFDRHYPHTRRIPIVCVAVCFLFAYSAERFFGVADITGAYLAGLMLSNMKDAHYVDRRVEISNYMIFGPVFFASIGINMDFSGFTSGAGAVGFGLAFIAAGLAGKVVGCGLGALMCGYGVPDSLRVGIGMTVRAEVMLVCAQKGIDNAMVDPSIMPFVVLLILFTSIIAPVLLKLSYPGVKGPGGNVLPAPPPEDDL